MLTDVVLSVVMVSFIARNVDCRYAEFIMLNVTFLLLYDECCYAECRYAEFHYTVCRE